MADRWIDRIRGAWKALLSPPTIGVGAAGEIPISADYSLLGSMSALARFPWVRVCALARAGDLAGLPLIAVRRNGSQEQILEGHEALDLLRRPNDRTTGLRFRRQIYVDFQLAGNAFLRILGAGGTRALLRLHPAQTRPIVDGGGLVHGFEVGATRLAYEEVLHIADVSWSDTATQVLGEGAIRSLHDDLTAELAAKEMAATQAKRGRLDFLLTPRDHTAAGGDELMRRIEERYEAATRAKHGLFIIGDAFEAQQVGLSARDMEFAQMRHDTRDMVLAVFGVPPTRAGIPAANYGTAKQEMRSYWEALLRGMAALFNDEFSRLTGDSSIRIEHDPTDVEALQVSYTERQMRASTWVHSFGADPAAAAAYEGFPDAPTGTAGVPAERPDKEPDEPQGSRRTLLGLLTVYLRGAAHRYEVSEEPIARAEAEAQILGRALRDAGMPAALARSWAEEIAAQTDEAVAQAAGLSRSGLEHLAAFGAARARRLACAIQRARVECSAA